MHLLMVSLLSLTTLFVNAPPPPDWTAYSSAEGRFSAALPDEPRTTVVVTETAKGPLYTHTVSATDKDLNEYLVSWTSYDRKVESRATEKTFDHVRDALISSKGGKLVSESAISMLGRTARAITFTDSDGRKPSWWCSGGGLVRSPPSRSGFCPGAARAQLTCILKDSKNLSLSKEFCLLLLSAITW